MSSKIKLKCPICKTVYSVYPSVIKYGGGKTCSLKCSYIMRGLNKTKNLTGIKRGNLTILNRVKNKASKVAWSAKCNCGNITIVTSQEFLKKNGRNTKSCGCMRYLKGSDSPHWRGSFGISAKYWGSIKSAAEKRCLDFTITQKLMFKIFELQDKKCALSGVAIILNDTASIDRINSNLGYNSNNIQWVHKDVNRMKSNFSEKYFLNICNLIANKK